MKRLFGTNGVRGLANSDMNINLATDLGRAMGTFFKEGEIAIASDTRTSSDMLRNAVIAGVLSTGMSVCDLGVLPSPALQFAVKNGGYNGGIIITASHNPPEFNGIKVIDPEGLELARSDEEQIESHYFERTFKTASWESIGHISRDDRWSGRYIEGILDKLDADSIRKKEFSIVLDCANGASYQTSPALFKKLGCRLRTVNEEPDGTFPGHPSEPTPENLRDISQAVVDMGADVGIAHDGDADRTIFFDEKGNFLQGDKSLSLMAGHILSRKKGIVVTPVSSSSCVEDVVRKNGGEILYSKVGAPIVARTMFEKGAVFGGEENGGMIFPEHQYCRDGAMAAAKVVEMLAITGESLSKLVSELPVYHNTKTKVTCQDEKKPEALEKMAEAVASENVDKTDGLKIYFDSEWILIRPSGTEPIIRVYAEARSREQADALAERYSKMLKEIVAQLS
jgi:phosphomannomutase/phosphoglucomutase